MNDFQTWIALYKESYRENKVKIQFLLGFLVLLAIIFFIVDSFFGLLVFSCAVAGGIAGSVFTHFILYLFWRHNGTWIDLKNEHFKNDVK